MSQIISDALALMPKLAVALAAILGILSAISKGLESIAVTLTGKPQVIVSEADGLVLKAIGVLQIIVDWLAPRTSTPNPPSTPTNPK